MRIRKHCLIIILLCFSCLMNASGFMFKHLEVKEGLSNNQILDIFKDSEGFMWFATASGLNRYDGDRMTLFRSYNAEAYKKIIKETYGFLPVQVTPFIARSRKRSTGMCMNGYGKLVLMELLLWCI